MNRRLKDLATIQFGLYNKPATEGEIFYLQNTTFMKELLENSFNTYLSRKDISPNHILQKDDILVAAKGFHNRAIKYDSNYAPAVASSLFFIVKPDTSLVHPDYLTIYLNDMKTQNLLKKLSGATTVPHISKKDLAEIEIPLLPLDKQKAIAAFMNNWNREKQITKKLLERKEQLYSSVFNQLISQ